MSTLSERVMRVRDELWQLAKEHLEGGDMEVYDALRSSAEQITRASNAATTRQDGSGTRAANEGKRPTDKTATSIFKQYKGDLYRAEYIPSHRSGGQDDCVYYQGQWMTPSGAAMKITNGNVNGWRFWCYKREDGTSTPIDDLR